MGQSAGRVERVLTGNVAGGNGPASTATPESVPTQLMGAMGAWLRARPADAKPHELDVVTKLVLDTSLLGVGVDDEDAVELAALTPTQQQVVDEVRRWVVRQRAVLDRQASLTTEAVTLQAQPQEAPTPSVTGPSRASSPSSRASAFTGALRTTDPSEPVQAHPSRREHRFVAEPGPELFASPPPSAAPTCVDRVSDPVLFAPPSPAWALPDAVAFEPSRPGAGPTEKEPAESLSSHRRRYEEAFWWLVCFVAVAILLWRQLS